jgi:hypothetical protein
MIMKTFEQLFEETFQKYMDKHFPAEGGIISSAVAEIQAKNLKNIECPEEMAKNWIAPERDRYRFHLLKLMEFSQFINKLIKERKRDLALMKWKSDLDFVLKL